MRMRQIGGSLIPKSILKRRQVRSLARQHGIEEPALGKLIRSLNPPPKRFVDIGAFIGVYTRLVGSFPGSEVWAFEPDPTWYHVLRSKTKQMRNVHAFNYALGSAEGMLPFSVRWPSGGSFVIRSSREVIVQVKTLDSLGLRPDFIKIDTEGFELEVLRGALVTLRDSRPTLAIEYHGSENFGKLLPFLEAHRYKYAKIEGSENPRPDPFDLNGQLICHPSDQI